MKLLKNRAFLIPAAILIILVVGVASAFGDLKSDVRKTENLFFEGVKSDSGGYTRPSVYEQMRSKYTTANSILGVIDSYSVLAEPADALRTAKDHVYDLLSGSQDGSAIRGLSAANEEMIQAVEKLKTALEDIMFPDRERKALDRYLKDMEGAQSVIEASGYNDAAREFNGRLERFPANLMVKLLKNPNGAAYF